VLTIYGDHGDDNLLLSTSCTNSFTGGWLHISSKPMPRSSNCENGFGIYQSAGSMAQPMNNRRICT
jgi:hypothetical protein